MILQALTQYYERMVADPKSSIARPGFSKENISFGLVISKDGQLLDIEDLREQDGNRLRPRKLVVPAAEKKANGIKSNFLWDNTSYVLGTDDKNNHDRTQKCHEAFISRVKEVCGKCEDGAVTAVMHFLSGNNFEAIKAREDWPEICGSNLVFRLDGEKEFVHERSTVRNAWTDFLSQKAADSCGQCLISGARKQNIARLHPSIKGVRGAQSSGASIVSFNLPAFTSYGKEQSFNAPVSEKAAAAYTTALNTLLAPDSRQKIAIGDTTMVFWAERPSLGEDFFADLFDPVPTSKTNTTGSEDDQQTTARVRGVLQAIREGRPARDVVPGLDENVRFYILGLAPNASRLSIRFWEENSLGEVLRRVGRHFDHINIVRQFDNEPEFPPLWRLLCQTAAQGKNENVSPVLAGGMTASILKGVRYPQPLLTAVLGRIRAEKEVGYFRASLLKGFLKRNRHMEDITMSLDVTRKDEPYLLGRLFATLEKAQEEAIPGTNATIKDRFLGSASATPGQVFPVLLKNSANHISKLRKNPDSRGRATNLDKMIQELVDGLNNFEKTMPLDKQGIFMIGYYHQRKDFFTKKEQQKQED